MKRGILVLVCMMFLATFLFIPSVQATGGITLSSSQHELLYSGGPYPYYWYASDTIIESKIPGDDRDYGMAMRYQWDSEDIWHQDTFYRYAALFYSGESPGLDNWYESAVESDWAFELNCWVDIYEPGDVEGLPSERILLLYRLPPPQHSWDEKGGQRDFWTVNNPDGSYSLIYNTTLNASMVNNIAHVGSKFSIEIRIMENPEASGSPFVAVVNFRTYLTGGNIQRFDFGTTLFKSKVEDTFALYHDSFSNHHHYEWKVNNHEYLTVIPSTYLVTNQDDFDSESWFFNGAIRQEGFGASNTWLTYPVMLIAPTGVHSAINEPEWTEDYYQPTRDLIQSYLTEPTLDVELDGDYSVSGAISRGDTFTYSATVEHENENFLLDAKASFRHLTKDEDFDGFPDVVFDESTVAMESLFYLSDVVGNSALLEGDFTLPMNLDDGLYMVVLDLFDKTGNWVYAVSQNIAIGDVASNAPPSIGASLTSEVIFGEPVEITIAIYDEGSTVKYKVYWGDGVWEQGVSGSNWLTADFTRKVDNNKNEFIIILEHDYAGAQVYEVNIYAQDNFGLSPQIFDLPISTLANEEAQLELLSADAINVLWGFLIVFGIFLLINRTKDAWGDLSDERAVWAKEREELEAQDVGTAGITRHTMDSLKIMFKFTKLGWFLIVLAVGMVLVVWDYLTADYGLSFWDAIGAIYIENTLLYMKVFAFWLSNALWGVFTYQSVMGVIGFIVFGFMAYNVLGSLGSGGVRRRVV